ncbi:hypothetical protein BGY98DRAFT_91312 [Russula aff. rugulosa BPL654]|nr:hypothetical protein BGY98DRAFT_91312 [Russula aff. rugulosa BPL654]
MNPRQPEHWPSSQLPPAAAAAARSAQFPPTMNSYSAPLSQPPVPSAAQRAHFLPSMNQPQLSQDIQQLKQDVHQLQQLQQRSHLPPSFHPPPQAAAQSAQFLPAMNQPQLAQDVQQLKRDVHQLQQLQQQQIIQIDQILADHAKMNQTLVQINQRLQNKTFPGRTVARRLGLDWLPRGPTVTDRRRQILEYLGCARMKCILWLDNCYSILFQLMVDEGWWFVKFGFFGI